ncbi:tail fiber domain-containing protein [Salmonella enterica]|nr:tail fiber domain-containing protein [Salmonella enterica]
MPPIDDRTPKLDLPLPAQPNTLKNDVQRLRDTITSLDDKVVVIDPTTGKMDSKFLPDKVAVLVPPHATLDPAMLPPEVVTVDATGKIPEDKIPDDARTNIHTVASEVLMLELDASVGDIARVTNSGKTFMLMGKTGNVTPPQKTDRGDWKEQVSKVVSTVNGRNGAIVVAEAGVNNDITQLNALTGPLRLGGDASQPYDAVTLRQLQAAGAGGGANMSGVMNNFIGAVEWFAGTRAKLPAGYIPADGQLVSRTDPATSDLWLAVNKGQFVSVTDAEWILNPNASPTKPFQRVGNRGSYSLGDGSTNFRIPDLNGVRRKGDLNDGAAFTGDNSITGSFLRGDGGGAITGIFSSGAVNANAAPEIKGNFRITLTGTTELAAETAKDAFAVENPSANVVVSGGLAGGSQQPRPVGLTFKASRGGSDVYGRDETGEIRPNAVTGIWIIRANGSFNAANTEYNVINADAADPAIGITVHGGILKSRYNANGKTRLAAANYANFNWGGSAGAASHNLDIIAYNDDGTVAANATYMFQANGVLKGGLNRIESAQPQLMSWSETGQRPGVYGIPPTTIGNNFGWAPIVTQALSSGGGYLTTLHLGQIFNNGGSFGECGLHIAGDANAQYAVRLTVQPNREEVYFYSQIPANPQTGYTGGTWSLTKGPVSDERLKHNIQDTDGQQALSNIEAMRFRTFVFNSDEQKRVRRGLIAQELETVDPLYVKTKTYHPEQGKPHEQKELDTAPLLLDALAAIKVLAAQNKDLQAQIDELKAKP